ncbi:MAG: 4Fe-4S binding protein [Bacteroidales bacterium]|nr:4Fe-4S binding protein [Bacteroidales bacterium]
MKYFHSHVIIPEKCTGRMKCIRSCPTKAIRIRQNKIIYFDDLCVDCGACINACPENVYVPVIDEISDFEKFELKIALPSRILYTQFGLNIHPHLIHKALKQIGFDLVVDTSQETHDMSFVISEHLKLNPGGRPIISSFCPAIIRFIQVRYPNLMELISTFDVPREITAKTAKEKYSAELGIPVNKIGVIYITPCPAMVVSIKQPAEKEKSWIDGAIAIKDIYNIILPEILKIQDFRKQDEPENYFFYGRGWGGLCHIQQHLDSERCMSVRGIDNVKMILDDIEDSRLRNVDYIEAFICSQGCIAGAFCVENPYISRHNSIMLEKRYSEPVGFNKDEVMEKYRDGYYFMEQPILPRPTRSLAVDIATSIKRMKQKERILTKLPKKDCSLCGAPSCETFAEDCAWGEADLTDCIFFKRTSL